MGHERAAYGDLTVGDRFQKHNYPFGVLVNARGERFLDEGLDFHSYTYAKYGHEVMKQPGLFAWQIFDAKIVHLLREEYRIARITKEQANTLEELAPKLTGVDTAAVLETLRRYNAAPRPMCRSIPTCTMACARPDSPIDKTNWAQKLDTPPFHAYGVTAGVTFTFGGLKATTSAEVEDTSGAADPRPVCRGRNPWRALLPQLRQRHRPGRRRRVRSHRRRSCGA